MRKLIRYLKPFTGAMLLIFALLFVQAMADLALPGYMSDIINIGVQQKGIENAVPEAMRQSEMRRLFLFMNPSDQALLKQDYQLLDKATLTPADYARYVADFPSLASAPVYKLNQVDKAEIGRLNAVLAPPELAVSAIEQKGAAVFTGTGLNLPPGADPFAVLGQLPPEQLAQAQILIKGQMGAVPASVVTQSAAAYLALEYKAIGLDVGAVQTGYMMRIGLVMLAIALLSAACSVAVGYFASRVAAGFARNLREKLFAKVENFSSNEFDKFSTASLITRTTNDIQQIQMLMVMLMRIVFYAPILGVGAIIRALGEDVSMSWIIAAAVMALLGLIAVAFTVAVPKFRLVQKLLDRLNLVTREILTGLMVVRAFNRQPYEEQRFDAANVDVTRVSLFVNRVMVVMMPFMMLLLNGVTLLIIWVGAKQVDLGRLQVGNMIAFMQYAMQTIFSFLMVSLVMIMLPRASVSGQRVAEVLETPLAINDPPEPKPFDPALRGVVEFRDVCFKYPGAEDYVLQDVSFTARPGQTVAFVGSTGSGKSTLINLIPRFYDVTEGAVLVDGADIREVKQSDLRARLGYVPQKSFLFSGTIESNIKYGDEGAAQPQIVQAASTAQALPFIEESAQGFDTPVSEGATNFSGGQKQRLAIARALARRPEVFIFDDSFSALDFRTDAALRRALKQETAGATVLIVTQRISTVLQADQIIVLENGRVAGIGTHKELMEKSEVYRELALSQLSQAELSL